MESVSIAAIQELVRLLPENKLSPAYRLLRDLAAQPDPASPQIEFMRLPLSERRRQLSQQADEMARHYAEAASERQQWQAGDFQDEH